MEVVFRPNENLCLLAALWGVANGEQKPFDTETEFRRLRDDFWNGMVFEDGMKRLGGIEPKREYVGSSRENGALAAYGKLELCGRQRRDTKRI